MSLTRTYGCDLCGAGNLTHETGIAIYHGHKPAQIKALPLRADGCGHHLCNNCVRGLGAMIAELRELHHPCLTTPSKEPADG